MNAAAATVPDDVTPDFAVLRARRSPFWRPGMNTTNEPWVALAETNVGHLMVPCGANMIYAREVATRWRLLTELGHGIGYAEAHCVGAAVVDPRGEVQECWRLPEVGSVPVPGGPTRWAPLIRLQRWQTCLGCGERRWPGTWVVQGVTGCALCQPAREADDPRVWPVEPPALSDDPETEEERAERKAKAHVRPVRAATRPFSAGLRRRPKGGIENQPERG